MGGSGLASTLSQLEPDQLTIAFGPTGKEPAKSAGAAKIAYEGRLKKLREGFKGKEIPAGGLKGRPPVPPSSSR